MMVRVVSSLAASAGVLVLGALSMTAVSLADRGDETPRVVKVSEETERVPGGVARGATGPCLPETLHEYADIDYPAHFLTNTIPGGQQLAVIFSDNEPASNPVTNEGATLGRVLFYDKNLSANGSVSCASCHVQSHGFSDPNVFSFGFEGGLTGRHSMGLANARFYLQGRFFWDERAATLEDQVLMPFFDPVEMGMNPATLVAAVQSQPYYADLFVDAFGDSAVTTDRVSEALAQFVRSLVSTESKYDTARAAESSAMDPFAGFTASENLGKQLFMTRIRDGGAGCINCHTGEAFVNRPSGPVNNGLAPMGDLGVGGASGNPGQNFAFKVPSLRNIAIRPPYMHDGRFATLEAVVEHYNSGVQDMPTLHPQLRDDDTGLPIQLGLTSQEKAALVDFMETLTDDAFLTAEKFSDPFVCDPAGCNPADLNDAAAPSPAFAGFGVPDGLLSPTDFAAFSFFFATGDLRADINLSSAANPAFPGFGTADGLLTPTDFSAFVAYYSAGCPCSLPGCP